MKYAIVGFGDSWTQTPTDDPDVKIVGLNELYKYLVRWDEWIEIHDEDSLGLSGRVAPGQVRAEIDAHRAWLSKPHAGKTIWMQERFCDGRFPAAKPFPLADLQRKFAVFSGGQPWGYFTSTVAYMLAMLIARGRDEKWHPVDDSAASWIGLFGIDLIGEKEYEHQRPCAELFIGIAMAMGITVHVPERSAVLKSDALYGFEPRPSETGPITMARLRAREGRLRKQHDGLVADIHKVKGALTETLNWITVFEASRRGVGALPDRFLDEAKVQ